MMSYTLKCENEHSFESWFKSSDDYTRLKQAGLVECAVCGTTNVEKSIMAPNVSAQRENKADNPTQIRKVIKDQLKDAKNVGWQFAKEARAIHYGDKEHTPIYGKTDPQDAIELIKEGVKIAPLPFDPDAKEN